MPPPPVSDPFYWTLESWGPALRCRSLDQAAPHLFTSRQLALSSSDDWRQAAEAIGAARVVTAAQVHGRNVLVVRSGSLSHVDRAEADVLVSNDPEVAVAVRAADCVPILIADSQSRAVAAVHAGWRGTAAGAAVAAVEALQREFGSTAANMVAAIGPAIGACCYEVGSDLVDAFAAAGHARHLIDRWFLAPRARGSGARPPLRLDLPAANRDQLILAGVPEVQIHIAGLCTAMHLRVLTSFRAERENAGRIAGVIRAPRPSPRSRDDQRPC